MRFGFILMVLMLVVGCGDDAPDPATTNGPGSNEFRAAIRAALEEPVPVKTSFGLAFKNAGRLHNFDGHIGKTQRIGMTLVIDGKNLRGCFFFHGDLKDRPIEGNVDASGHVTLLELNKDGRPASVFNGNFIAEGLGYRRKGYGEKDGPLRNEELVGNWYRVGEEIAYAVRLRLNNVSEAGEAGRYSPAGADYNVIERSAQSFWNAVRVGAREVVADHIAFPVKVHCHGLGKTALNRAEFISNYDRIFTNSFKRKIRAHAPHNMVAVLAGIMLGNGEVWFNPKGKVMTLNCRSISTDIKGPSQSPHMLVQLHGTFGKQIETSIVRAAIHHAKKAGIKNIVFDLDSDGGSIHTAFQIQSLIVKHDDEIHFSVLVRKGLGASIWVVFACDSVFFADKSQLGGAAVFRKSYGDYTRTFSGSRWSGGAKVDAKNIGPKIEAIARWKGHPHLLVSAMMDPDVTFYAWKNRRAKIAQSRDKPPGFSKFIGYDNENTVLTLDGLTATNMGFGSLANTPAGISSNFVRNDHGVLLAATSSPYSSAWADMNLALKNPLFAGAHTLDFLMLKKRLLFTSNALRLADDRDPFWEYASSEELSDVQKADWKEKMQRSDGYWRGYVAHLKAISVLWNPKTMGGPGPVATDVNTEPLLRLRPFVKAGMRARAHTLKAWGDFALKHNIPVAEHIKTGVDLDVEYTSLEKLFQRITVGNQPKKAMVAQWVDGDAAGKEAASRNARYYCLGKMFSISGKIEEVRNTTLWGQAGEGIRFVSKPTTYDGTKMNLKVQAIVTLSTKKKPHIVVGRTASLTGIVHNIYFGKVSKRGGQLECDVYFTLVLP